MRITAITFVLYYYREPHSIFYFYLLFPFLLSFYNKMKQQVNVLKKGEGFLFNFSHFNTNLIKIGLAIFQTQSRVNVFRLLFLYVYLYCIKIVSYSGSYHKSSVALLGMFVIYVFCITSVSFITLLLFFVIEVGID